MVLWEVVVVLKGLLGGSSGPLGGSNVPLGGSSGLLGGFSLVRRFWWSFRSSVNICSKYQYMSMSAEALV